MDKVKIMKEILKELLSDMRSDPYLRAVVVIFFYFLIICFFAVFVLAPMFHSWPYAFFGGNESEVIIGDLSISGFNDGQGCIQTNILELIDNVKNGGVRQSTLPREQGWGPSLLLQIFI